MEQTLRYSGRLQSENSGAPLRTVSPLSLFIVVLLTVASLLAATVAVTTLANHFVQVSPSDPFTLYADIYPGQLAHIDRLKARGFRCGLDALPPPAYLLERCESTFQTNTFSAINLSIWDGSIVRLNFVPREGVLRIGDLTLLWGRPQIRVSGRWISMKWPERHISGSSQSEVGQFSYLLPVLHLSFG